MSEVKRSAKKTPPPKLQKEAVPKEILGLPMKMEIRHLRITNGIWFGNVGGEVVAFCEGCRAEDVWCALNVISDSARTLHVTGNCSRGHKPVSMSTADFWMKTHGY